MSYPEGRQRLFQKLDEDLQRETKEAGQEAANPSKMRLLRKRHILESIEESSKESKKPHDSKHKMTSSPGPKSKRVSNSETETSGNSESDTAEPYLLSEEQNQPFPVGTIIWGQFSGKQWFPAMVITGPLAGQSPAKVGWTWVMWFGDHKINEIRWKHIDSFLHQYRSRVSKKLALSREEAIVEALKECAARANVPGIDDFAKAKRWGITSFGFQEFISKDKNAEELISLKPGMPLPHLMELELKKLREAKYRSNKNNNESKVPETDSKNPLASSKRKQDCDRKLHLKDIVVKGDFCLGCGQGNQKVDKKHPLFQGYICSKCEDCLRESLLALDIDGCNMFCVICGEPGSLCVCESDSCGRSYCDKCLNIYLTPELYEMVHQKSYWLCYLCTDYKPGTHGLLKPRDDWQDEVVKFFNPPSRQQEIRLDVFQGPKRKLRVLSLFDGIAVAYLALQRLGLDIEAYYACEICENAKQVITYNHGKVITQLGDIQCLDVDMLESILPIDLVIGSPPKEDLDVTNIKHEGFNGSGMYMMQFWLLLKNVEFVSYGNRDTPIFWLVENTASMKSEYRQSISKMYGVEPCMWDAQFFGPYVHPGLFWGNIPDLDSVVQRYIENKEQVKLLNSYVTTQLKRQAQVSKLRNCAIDAPPKKPSKGACRSGQDSSQTELGSRNVSLMDGDLEESRSAVKMKNKDMFDNKFLYPVLAEGVSTNIWVQEVEKALNLPAHYTDCCRLTIRDRQKLLRQASSVDVLTHVLAPLAKVYALK